MADDVDALMAELDIATPTQATSTGVSENDVDALMQEIGVSTDAPSAQPAGIEADVDDLLAEIGVSPSGPAKPAAGRGRAGMSSGPGAAWARGRSSGPGRGTSSGPGRGRSSGPGAGPGRGRALPTHTPDGREIKHEGPLCATCGEMCIGQFVNALEKSYHPECFVCKVCSQPFPNGQFVPHEGEPYCMTHYNELHAPKCNGCGLAIMDKCIATNSGKKYHPEHFVCSGCGEKLAGKQYKEEGDEGVFCTKCREARAQRTVPDQGICGKCKKKIFGDYIVLGGLRMHAEHFRCEECGNELKGSDCHEWEGALYDLVCYNKMLRNLCASCNKHITGRSVTALGKVWHPEHFVCFICREPFSGSNFYEHDKKPYCETHYAQEFGDCCQVCNKPVIHDAIEFLASVYHSECFKCTGCEKLLKKGDVTEWEGKPMCFKCYKNLPKKVREQVEKKRAAEKKAAKQREKEEKKAAKKKK